jgi:hypothetical protein
VDSIARTLEANVARVQRVKILIHGQEVETLAGHVDLTGAFVVNTRPAPSPSKPASSAPTTAPGMLTPEKSPGKLAQPERKP